MSESGPRLHSLRWGDQERPPLVLLHGGGANAHWWDHIAPAFTDRFHVVALDFRGHGDSDRPADLIAGAFDADLAALLIDLGQRPTTLVGHSMGAHVALDHSTRYLPPALVLIDPSRGSDARHSRRLRLALSLRQNYARRQDAIDRYRFLPDSEHASEALRLSVAHHSVDQNPDGTWGYKFDPRWFGLARGARPDPHCVTCPTLIVRGAESGILSDEGAQALRDELPAGELVTVARAGHHVQIDRPAELIRAVRDFLERHPTPVS